MITTGQGPGAHDASLPWTWTAGSVAAAIRAKEVSAREVAECHLSRIGQVNPVLNALVELFPEETLDAAGTIDRAVARGEDPGPLAGVPTVIKINTDQRGHATSHGLPTLRDAIADRDAPVVANLRGAGAVVVGRGNSPALGFRSFTSNALHGRTLSPWSATRTPGGSSGGSAVAVATGMAALGQGNDLAGSIRYPAYACGLLGIRPTVGRVPRGSTSGGLGDSLMSQLMTVDGPLARTCDDLRLALQVMGGRGDPRDLFWAPPPSPYAEAPSRRVAVVRDPGVVAPSAPVTNALDEASRRLSEAGYQVEDVSLALLGEAFRLWWFLALQEYRDAPDLLEQAGDVQAATVVRNYESVSRPWWPAGAAMEGFLAGYGRRQVLIQRLQAFMEERPLLVLPVSAEPPFEHDLDAGDAADTERFMVANWPMMALATLTIPAVAVPTGLIGGLPTGVQIAGPRHSDLELLAAATEIMDRGPRLTPVSPVWAAPPG